jgi:hypothetical protein
MKWQNGAASWETSITRKPTALCAAEARSYTTWLNRWELLPLDFEFRCVPAWQHFAELLSAGYVGRSA